MPWWPFGRTRPAPLLPLDTSPTWELEQRAAAAFNAHRWQEAARLYRRMIAKADAEGRQVARNMLGRVYERLQRVDEAIAL
jgi:hypothetical protein